MRKIRHPKIVLFIGPAVSEDFLYIITEYMPMKSLEHVLREQKGALSYKKRVAGALDIGKLSQTSVPD